MFFFFELIIRKPYFLSLACQNEVGHLFGPLQDSQITTMLPSLSHCHHKITINGRIPMGLKNGVQLLGYPILLSFYTSLAFSPVPLNRLHILEEAGRRWR